VAALLFTLCPSALSARVSAPAPHSAATAHMGSPAPSLTFITKGSTRHSTRGSTTGSTRGSTRGGTTESARGYTKGHTRGYTGGYSLGYTGGYTQGVHRGVHRGVHQWYPGLALQAQSTGKGRGPWWAREGTRHQRPDSGISSGASCTLRPRLWEHNPL